MLIVNEIYGFPARVRATSFRVREFRAYKCELKLDPGGPEQTDGFPLTQTPIGLCGICSIYFKTGISKIVSLIIPSQLL